MSHDGPVPNQREVPSDDRYVGIQPSDLRPDVRAALNVIHGWLREINTHSPAEHSLLIKIAPNVAAQPRVLMRPPLPPHRHDWTMMIDREGRDLRLCWCGVREILSPPIPHPADLTELQLWTELNSLTEIMLFGTDFDGRLASSRGFRAGTFQAYDDEAHRIAQELITRIGSPQVTNPEGILAESRRRVVMAHGREPNPK